MTARIFALNKLTDFGLALVVPLVLLALWWIAAQRAWVPDQSLPSPSEVYAAFVSEYTAGAWWSNVAASLLRITEAFVIAAVVGVLIGSMLAAWRIADQCVTPLFLVYAQTPVIAWVPVGLLLFGINENLPVFLITISAVVPILANTYKGIKNVRGHFLDLARLYRLNTLRLWLKILLPGAAPSIFVGLRYGLAQAWLTVVIGEMVGVNFGIGAEIVQARNLFQIDTVLAYVITLAAIGIVTNKLAEIAEAAIARRNGALA